MNFHILKESTRKFDGGELCVMLILNNGKYYIEVTTQSKSCGRKFISDTEADFLFEITVDFVNRQKNIKAAEKTLNKCLRFKSYGKTVFSLYMMDRIATQDDIVYLRNKVWYRTILKRTGKDEVTIHIVTEFKKKPYGYFVGKDTLRDLKFTLI